MGNRQSVPMATTTTGRIRREAAGGNDTTGMSVTGADGVTGAATGADGVTGAATGADGVTGTGADADGVTGTGADADATGVTGASGGTTTGAPVGKHNWAASNTKASGGKDATTGKEETTGTGNVGKEETTGSGTKGETSGASAGKGEETGGSGVCIAGKTGEYAAQSYDASGKPCNSKRQFGFTPAQLQKRDRTGCTTECNAGPAPEDDAPKPPPTPVVPVVRDENVEAIEPDLDQCGLDPDPEGRMVEAPLDPRIKESRLTPEEKTKCHEILDKIFKPIAIAGRRVDFPPQEVLDITDMIIPYLESEPMLIEDVPFDIIIVADLHGQLYDLDRVFRDDARDGKPGWECQKYLFLGDYVDRGRQSLEIVMALYCIKMLYPDQIFLLRGNHEYVHTNATNGFMLDFHDRYCEETRDQLYYTVNETFCYLSCAAIVGNSYFCAHAGISPQAFTRRQMIAVRKPIIDSREDILIHDLVWADIAKGLNGTTLNGKRAASIYFGLDELCLALYNIKCTGLFRGHTIQPHGFDFIAGLCMSLFTASGAKNYNSGAVAILDKDGKMSIRTYECNPERVAWVNKLKRMDGARHDEADDELTVDDAGEGTPTMSQ